MPATAKQPNPKSHGKTTIFLIGASGRVGNAAVRYLAQCNDVHLIAGLRDPERGRDRLPAHVEVRRFDLDDRPTIDRALVGVERLLLLTGYTVDMLKQSQRVIDALKDAGGQHIVHIGASGRPTAEVAHWGWHRMIEAYIETQGFGFTHLQPEAFMQNIMGFGWLSGQRLTNLIGDAVWSWVDAEDVGLLAANALHRPQDFRGQRWRLGYHAASMADVALMLQQTLDAPIALKPQAPEDFYRAAVAAGGDPAYLACIRDQFLLDAAGAIGDAERTFDPQTFADAVGRAPTMWPAFLTRERAALRAAVEPA